MSTAILIDGGFFLKRYRYLRGTDKKPSEVADDVMELCNRHLGNGKRRRRRLYRILFYDCPPLTKKAHHPISGKAIDFSRTPVAAWRREFHDELRKKRKVALRLGYLNEDMARWELRPEQLKKLLKKEISTADLTEDDVTYQAAQKGVDMKIGVDIASLVHRGRVDQIVLVAGDSDFVPAAKYARREGIDFVLDAMRSKIRDDLHEHIDGLRSVWPDPKRTKS